MKNGRNTAGHFSPGNSGRPHGSRNKATLAIEGLLEGQAEALPQTAITKALEGDSVALRLCMDRIAPPPDPAVTFSMPTMRNAMDAAEANGRVLRAVIEGELTPRLRQWGLLIATGAHWSLQRLKSYFWLWKRKVNL